MRALLLVAVCGIVGAGSYYLLRLWASTNGAFKTRLLATIPEDVVEPNGGWHVHFSVDDVPGGESLPSGAIIDVAFRGLRGRQAVVFRGSDEWGPYDLPKNYFGSQRFDPNGRRFAFIADRQGKRIVVLDGTEHAPYDDILPYPGFNRSGSHFMYTADVRGLLGKRRVVVVDGVASSDYEFVWETTFTPDDKLPAYIAERKQEQVVVVGSRSDATHNRNIVFLNDDGSRIARIERTGESFVMVTGTERSQPYYLIMPDAVAVSRNRRTIAFVVVDGTDLRGTYPPRLIVGGQPVDSDWGIDTRAPPALSDDGESVAYFRKTSESLRALFVKNGAQPPRQIGPSVCGGYFPRFLADGRTAFIGWLPLPSRQTSPSSMRDEALSCVDSETTANTTFIVDGQLGPLYNYVEERDFVLAADARRHAYRGRRGDQWFVVVDGRQLSDPVADAGEPIFSPAGRHIAWVERHGKGDQRRDVLAIAGRKEAIDGYVESRPMFSRDGRYIGVGVRKGRELWWKVWPTVP